MCCQEDDLMRASRKILEQIDACSKAWCRHMLECVVKHNCPDFAVASEMIGDGHC